jgi:hypothetical protein
MYQIPEIRSLQLSSDCQGRQQGLLSKVKIQTMLLPPLLQHRWAAIRLRPTVVFSLNFDLSTGNSLTVDEQLQVIESREDAHLTFKIMHASIVCSCYSSSYFLPFSAITLI